GKNLVDIILTNNGYTVHNLGIKQPVENIIHAFEEHRADAIGMSGLLVKSTLVMKENLEVLNEQGLKPPVVLGGAALTRRYVEQELQPLYNGIVSYANDAFDGLRFMEKLKKDGSAGSSSGRPDTGESDEETEELLTGAEAKIALAMKEAPAAMRSNVSRDVPIPTAPFWGTKVVDTIRLEEIYSYINEAALIKGQWQVRKGKRSEAEYRAQLEEQIYPELSRLKSLAEKESLLQPRVVYGYFPCNADGNDLVVYSDEGAGERARFTFPRQKDDRHLCLADYFAPADSGRRDVVAFHMVTMGKSASEYSAKLFASNDYKEYLYFHGLSVECTEALAELWHQRIRAELGIGGKDAANIKRLFSQGYQGARYSFGYAACPNLEDHVKLFALLQPERIGVTMTEEFMLDPEQSTDAIIIHHPEARYFNI
ncbi:MAG: cobalamin-dependent protein, partial [Ignavibacteriales bacterium]|nr:cobalamin-dependent protein [Ignavibacteriales bacterium]